MATSSMPTPPRASFVPKASLEASNTGVGATSAVKTPTTFEGRKPRGSPDVSVRKRLLEDVVTADLGGEFDQDGTDALESVTDGRQFLSLLEEISPAGKLDSSEFIIGGSGQSWALGADFPAQLQREKLAELEQDKELRLLLESLRRYEAAYKKYARMFRFFASGLVADTEPIRVPVSATFLEAKECFLQAVDAMEYEMENYVPVPILHHEEPDNVLEEELLHDTFALEKQNAFDNNNAFEVALLYHSPPSSKVPKQLALEPKRLFH